MSRTFHHGKRGRERPIRVRGVRRDPPDVRGIARVLIALAQAAQAEAEAEAEYHRSKRVRSNKATKADLRRDTRPRGDAA